MHIIINNIEIPLQKKERKIGSEAPAVKLTMQSGQTKVIGMMAPKVQAMITLPQSDSLSTELLEVIEKHKERSFIYIIASQPLDNAYDSDFYSLEFHDFAMKFGVYATDEVCAQSIFIINKEGEIVYREIVANLSDGLNIEAFDSALNEAIKFKKKGHTHENWMGV
ncbi:MAG: hypothetical protein KU38_00730 [Sulfurovum sp. FS08-3]|nr:MAG: hypothetical protein KU38_00730 [Sulfurovum sp. FS08-3]